MSKARRSLGMQMTLLLHGLHRVPVTPAAVVDEQLMAQCEEGVRPFIRYYPALAACLVGALLVQSYLVMPPYLSYYLPAITGPVYTAIADFAVAIGLGARNGAAVATPVAWLILIATALVMAGVLLLPFWVVYRRALFAQTPIVSLALAVERDRLLPSNWRDYPKSARSLRRLLGRCVFDAIVRNEVLTSASS